MKQLQYAYRHWVREGPLARSRASGLIDRERRSVDELRRLQTGFLRRTLRRAASVLPAYASLRGPLPADGLPAFLSDRFPIVTKEDLKSRREQFYPNRGQVRPWWSVGRTSGTTGTPLDVFRSYDSALWEHAFHMQHWRWAGLEPNERQVVLRGDLVVPIERSSPPFWFHDRLGRQLFVSTRHLSRAAVPHIARAIQEFGAVQLRAYPSAALELARLCEELALEIRFRSIITGSEMLYPTWRESIERVFGGRIFDFYGTAERVAFAAECESGQMHVNPEYSFVEIVDDRGVPTEGFGFIVGTTLHNLAMPLIRYQVQDSARWTPQPCPCGRSYPVLESLQGKLEERVFDLDGVAVSPSIITFAFKGVSNIKKSQVAQIARDEWVLRIVPGPNYSAVDGEALLRNFEALVSRRLRLRVDLKPEIANLPSGKFKWVSQEWHD